MEVHPLPLSEVVQNYIWGEDAGFVEMYPTDGREMLVLDQYVGECLRVSREEFSDQFVPAVEELAKQYPESVANSLDSLYVREMVKAVPGMVERTLQLAALSGDAKPSKNVNEYLREAVRTYVFGFPQATIALSRAVVEHAIKECCVQKPETTYLKDWLDQVCEERKIDPAIAALARTVCGRGNRVLHEKPASSSDAFEVLANARKFLTVLYGGGSD